MIGLLIVSHSRQIAEGVRDFADQMTQGRVPIVAAGGAADGALGTSADLIRDGLERLVAQQVEGIVVLVDLGSAVLSAEIALEGAPVPCRISDAPLVEGALLGAIEASLGSNLERVEAAALQSRALTKVHR
ncbi:dihydroxyacetone kinase phosphoryl donor subunit DhaM [Kallotenue papyrolyticum]|uniref:dihydroxyacetone kinase phosphoryl donor subunit DhaM n=1 Tax=Kallotenue papyrolyticum TaxID=1325125 RepID=UPI0004785F99|nr:dihydroxyacetone kinase phosphoryl donor subunit DhaM [Kallotenue papyrolyticum]